MEKIIKEKDDKIDPRTIESYLFAIEIDEKKYDSAQKRATAMVEKYPWWYQAYFYLGEVYRYKKELIEAEKYYLKANEISESAFVYARLAYVHYEEYKNYEKCLEFYKKALEINESAIMIQTSAFAAAYSAINLDKIDDAYFILKKLGENNLNLDKDESYMHLKEQCTIYLKNRDDI